MKRRADRRSQNIFIILSVLVALSMICGLAVTLLRAPDEPTQLTPAPTRAVATRAPTATPAIVAPTLAPPTAQPTPTR